MNFSPTPNDRIELEITPKAEKEFQKLDHQRQLTIADKLLTDSCKDPIKLQKNGGKHDLWRFRIGTYRVIFKNLHTRHIIVHFTDRKNLDRYCDNYRENTETDEQFRLARHISESVLADFGPVLVHSTISVAEKSDEPEAINDTINEEEQETPLVIEEPPKSRATRMLEHLQEALFLFHEEVDEEEQQQQTFDDLLLYVDGRLAEIREEVTTQFREQIVNYRHEMEEQVQQLHAELTKLRSHTQSIFDKVEVNVQKEVDSVQQTLQTVNEQLQTLRARQQQSESMATELAELRAELADGLDRLQHSYANLADIVENTNQAQQSMESRVALLDGLVDKIDNASECQRSTEEQLRKLANRVQSRTDRQDRELQQLRAQVKQLEEQQKRRGFWVRLFRRGKGD